VHSSHIAGIFLVFSFLVYFETVGIVISFRNVVKIFEMHISVVLELVVCLYFWKSPISYCYNFCVT
jgi:hypothetical protein